MPIQAVLNEDCCMGLPGVRVGVVDIMGQLVIGVTDVGASSGVTFEWHFFGSETGEMIMEVQKLVCRQFPNLLGMILQ
jgi:hypothetical protein